MKKNQSVVIRPIEKNSDFVGVSDCYWKDPEVPWDIYTNPGLLKRWVGPQGFLLAEVRGRVVGFVHYRRFHKRPWFDSSVTNYGQVLELHVKDQFQKRGIGRQLMEGAVEKLTRDGCGVIYTNTDESSLSAMKLYRRLGFKPILKTFYLKRKSSTV